MIEFNDSTATTLVVPPGYRGPVALPGTGRVVYWTGRVAIGLRYEPPRRAEFGFGMEELQRVFLRLGDAARRERALEVAS